MTLALLEACARLQPRPELPDQSALGTGEDATLDHAISALEAQHPGQSAFRLLTEGSEAFVTRMQSASRCAVSIFKPTSGTPT